MVQLNLAPGSRGADDGILDRGQMLLLKGQHAGAHRLGCFLILIIYFKEIGHDLLFNLRPKAF